jgi:hypothetical protein
MRQKNYKREYVLQGESISHWTVDEVIKELQKQRKYKEGAKASDLVEIYPKINEFGRMGWHFDVYRYNELKKNHT